MTSKLSFRSRALDATKPLPIYHDSEIPETADCSIINRTVPQMPTGMEKEEESEHHLQRAICAGTTIPTPEVFTIEDLSFYSMMYPSTYKTPRQLIYMQPFSMEPDIPDYDMDSEDEQWINSQSNKLELTPDKFEEMMDRLEKGSGQTVVTLQEAKALIKEDDDLIIAVYDYWLNKRLKTQHHLIPQVRTEARYGVSNHNPYIAFRRRTEKMQTRKNRKNDESSYEKMLKLRRDLVRAVSLLDMVKRREKSKRELLHLSIEVFERRYHCGDYTGQIIDEALSQRPARPSFTPLYPNNQMSWIKDETAFLDSLNKKVKRQYKKRRHKSGSKGSGGNYLPGTDSYLPGGDYIHDGDVSSDDDNQNHASPSDGDDEDEEGAFPFRRRMNCDYHPALGTTIYSPTPTRCSGLEEGTGDNYNFCPTSISKRYERGYRFVGNTRRRIGRGGRVILDRTTTLGGNEFWRSMGYSVFDSAERGDSSSSNESPNLSPTTEHGISMLPGSSSATTPGGSTTMKYSHYRPKPLPSPPPCELNPTDPTSDTEPESLTISDNEDEFITKPSNRIGELLGGTVRDGDIPMVYPVEDLFKDPEPVESFSGYTPGYLALAQEKSRQAPSYDETLILDKPSANLCNIHYIETRWKELEEEQLQMELSSDSYFPSTELPFNFDDLEQAQSSDLPVDSPQVITVDDVASGNIVIATFISEDSSVPEMGTTAEDPSATATAPEEQMEVDTQEIIMTNSNNSTDENPTNTNHKSLSNGPPQFSTIVHVVNGIGIDYDNTLNSQLLQQQQFISSKVEKENHHGPSTSAAVPTPKQSSLRSAVPIPDGGDSSSAEEAIVAVVDTGSSNMDQTSDSCSTIDEASTTTSNQKPNFLLTSKTLVLNCMT